MTKRSLEEDDDDDDDDDVDDDDVVSDMNCIVIKVIKPTNKAFIYPIPSTITVPDYYSFNNIFLINV